MTVQTPSERLAEARRLRQESRDAFNKFFDCLLKERSDLQRVADEELGILQCGSDSQKLRYAALRTRMAADLLRVFHEAGASKLVAGESHNAMKARLLTEYPTMMPKLAEREVGQFLYDRRELK